MKKKTAVKKRLKMKMLEIVKRRKSLVKKKKVKTNAFRNHTYAIHSNF